MPAQPNKGLQGHEQGPSGPSSMPSLNLRLFCIIEGEKRLFPVDIPAQADVSDLKKKIQNERALSTLQGVDPHILELWKVCIINIEYYHLCSPETLPLLPSHQSKLSLNASSQSCQWERVWKDCTQMTLFQSSSRLNLPGHTST